MLWLYYWWEVAPEIIIDCQTSGGRGQGHALVNKGDQCVAAVFAEVGWGPAWVAYIEDIGVVEERCRGNEAGRVGGSEGQERGEGFKSDEEK